MNEIILPDIPVSSVSSLEEQYNAVVDLRTKLENILQLLLINTTIENLALTISGSYQQTEVQQIADKVDSILTRLRNAGITGE